MKWYMPSFGGDFRLVPIDGASGRCTLVIHKPTPGETVKLNKFLKVAHKKRWTNVSELAGGDVEKLDIELEASVSQAGAELLKKVRDKQATLTAVNFVDGRLETAEGIEEKAVAVVAKGEKEGAKAAATVARPTPSCPQCTVGAVGPASEVLLSFLTPQQHDDWARHRALIVEGGYTGHRYLLAHRKTPTAAKIGRICYDIDSRSVVHFHDSMVPPEEEVLAAKLILEHREDWLRNEATMFGISPSGEILATVANTFQNPFGDVLDGVPDARLTRELGEGFAGFFQGLAISAKALS